METKLQADMRAAFANENPAEIAAIFARYYDPKTAKQIETLLATALRTMKIDEVARFMATINQFYHETEIKRLTYAAIFKGKQAALQNAADYFARGLTKFL